VPAQYAMNNLPPDVARRVAQQDKPGPDKPLSRLGPRTVCCHKSHLAPTTL
jgi:hypothetical protein